MKIECIPTGFLNTNCYIITGENYLMVVDPGDDFLKICDNLPYSPTCIVLTHCHFDHVGALYELKEKFPSCPIYIHEDEDYSEDFVFETAGPYIASHMKRKGFKLPKEVTRVKEGSTIEDFEVLSTPGHTMGSMCLYCKDRGILFSGDTLFYHSYGRTDLGGNEENLVKSLKKLMNLGPNTTVYPGHGQKTSINEEKSLLFF